MHLCDFKRAGIQIWDFWMLKMSDSGNLTICRVARAVDIIDQLSTTFIICLCTMYKENFLDYPAVSIVLAKNFTGETGTEKIKIGR